MLLGVAQEPHGVPLCNGEKTAPKSDEHSDRQGRDVDSQAATSSDAALSANNVNERLLTSVDDSLPLTDTSLSWSSLYDTSPLSSEATSLSHLASEDINQSVVAQP